MTTTAARTALAPAGPLPPRPRVPRVVQGLAFVLSRRAAVHRMARRCGPVFTVELPVFGRTVVVAEPQLARQVFAADPADLGNIQPNLSRVLGAGSVFALDGEDHRLRRRLLTPPFHGRSVRRYEQIFAEETLREIADWPLGRPVPTLPSMMRITLNVILRTVFGADGQQLHEMRELMPEWVTLGSRLGALPMPHRRPNIGPWRRLADYRRHYDRIVGELIDRVARDPDLEHRDDVLSLLLRSRTEDGAPLSRRDLADELLTLLAAGHETTAATLGWAFERVTRHPEVLDRLVAEARAGDDNSYRQRVIWEVQRTRTVIDFAGRHVYAPAFELGEWVVPRGYSIIVSLLQLHERAEEYPQPWRFDPDRYADARPPAAAWVPYGGGVRRCVGAVFANVEMDIVLRTVLRHCDIEPTTAPDEKVHARGVAYTPAGGGRITVRARR